MLITIIGLLATALTSLSYIPQVKKALPRGSTDDLSSKMLGVLAAGLALWIELWHPQKRPRDCHRECCWIVFGCHSHRIQNSRHASELSVRAGTAITCYENEGLP